MLIKDGIYFIIIKNRYIMKKIINIILVLWTAVFVMTGCNEGEKTNLKEKKSATETEIPDMGRIAAGAYYVAVLDGKIKYTLHGRRIISLMRKQKTQIGEVLFVYLKMRNFRLQCQKMEK